VRNNGIRNRIVYNWYNSTLYEAIDVRRLASAAKAPKPIEDAVAIDPGLATQIQRTASHGL
jgi:hypothetical protein